MSNYKREVLGVEEDGLWRGSRAYAHILPKKHRSLNILPSFKDEFWKWFGDQHPRILLHRDFHHLNSSQALCFNLCFPLMMGDGQGLAALLSAMGIAGLPTGACFEFQPDLTEDTCIDFSLPLQSGARVNFEIKYTETEFGSAKADKAHLAKFETIYGPRLAGRFEESFCCATKFLEHYQIARNIWHLNEQAGDIAVFLFPKANTRVRQQEPIIRACALEPFRSRIRIVYLEDLVLDLRERLEATETKQSEHLEGFRAKYLDFLEMRKPGLRV